MAETFAVSALSMDRGEPLGNSLDVFGRRSVHVKIGNSASEAIPVFVSNAGTPQFFETATQTTPGILQTLLTFTVPATGTRYLTQAIVVCRVEGEFFIKQNGSIIGSGRTGASNARGAFSYNPARPLIVGATITLEFTSRSGSKISDVEGYIHSYDA